MAIEIVLVLVRVRVIAKAIVREIPSVEICV